MEEIPLEPALSSRLVLSKWLWIIHNKVNEKLRSQKISVEPDPSFDDVKKFYEDLLAVGCSKTEFPGWDFLFSIADLHPLSKEARESVPISGAPPCERLKTLEEKNRWNCLTPEERVPLYREFWMSIGDCLPFKEWRKSWMLRGDLKGYDLHTKSSTLAWLWNTRCAMEHDLDLLNTCNYASLCKNLKLHRSGCTKSRRARTCRKRKDK
jgi:hypothetical protein